MRFVEVTAMMICAALQSLWWPGTHRVLRRELAGLWSGVSCTRPLESVQAPAGLRYLPGPRARRLMHTSRVSAW